MSSSSAPLQSMAANVARVVAATTLDIPPNMKSDPRVIASQFVALLVALVQNDTAELKEASPLRQLLLGAIDRDPDRIDEVLKDLPPEHHARLVAWLTGANRFVESGLGDLIRKARAPHQIQCNQLWADWA